MVRRLSGLRSQRRLRPSTTKALRLKIKPRDAEVYVDGYYVGVVDDFDGIFQRLHIESGPHRIEVRAPGYETLDLRRADHPDHTTTYQGEMKKLPVQSRRRTIAAVSGIYDALVGVVMLAGRPLFAQLFTVPPADPPIHADLNGLFLLSVAAGYLIPYREPDSRAAAAAYLWMMGPLLKGARRRWHSCSTTAYAAVAARSFLLFAVERWRAGAAHACWALKAFVIS